MNIVDVRSAEEFTGELGHIEDSELVPLATVADEDAWLLPAHFPTPTATKVRRGDAGFQLEWM